MATTVKDTQLLDRFVGIVEDEAGLYGRMPAILQREKQALAGADRKDLARICREKERLIARIRELDDARAQALQILADMAGSPRDGLTFSRLSRLSPEPQAARIRAAGEKLAALIRRIQAANQDNQSLIEHHLHLVKGAIAFVERTRKPNQVYRRTGELRSVRQNGRVFSGKI